MSKKPAPAKPAEKNFERLSTPRIGAAWKGQGGFLLGVVRGEGEQLDYCLVKPPEGVAAIAGVWGQTTRLAGAKSEYDGMANTRAMAEAGSEIAKQALALEFEGHRDYYIAARHEARIAYANCSNLYESRWYWTSTQYAGDSVYAWIQRFGNGGQYDVHKSYSYPAVLVRRIPIR